MAGNREVAGVPRPRLLVAKGSFESMGGAERDLLRNLPAIAESFDVSVATLASASELGSACEGLGLELMCPEERWSPPKESCLQSWTVGWAAPRKRGCQSEVSLTHSMDLTAFI